MGSEVEININNVIVKLLPDAIAKGLELCGQIVENDAKRKCPVDDGTLRASIGHEVEDNMCEIGTNVEYATFVHEGTGIYAVNGNGRKEVPWKYKTPDGKWHTTKGQKPVPFLRDAVDENMNEFTKVFENLLGGGQ